MPARRSQDRARCARQAAAGRSRRRQRCSFQRLHGAHGDLQVPLPHAGRRRAARRSDRAHISQVGARGAGHFRADDERHRAWQSGNRLRPQSRLGGGRHLPARAAQAPRYDALCRALGRGQHQPPHRRRHDRDHGSGLRLLLAGSGRE